MEKTVLASVRNAEPKSEACGPERSRRPDGREVILELYAAARGGQLFLIGARALADRHEQYRRSLETAVDSIRFGVALTD